jgi:ribonuclease-3
MTEHEHSEMLVTLESVLGYRFHNIAWLEEALTHPSCNLFAPKQIGAAKAAFNYQRLEFLGDSVLGLVISDLLFQRFPLESEGALARRKAALVESKMLAFQMQRWNIASFIRTSLSEAAGGGREKASLLEDVCEALIGAIYCDGGYDAAHRVITQHWIDLLELHAEAPKDAKTLLQEWAQAQSLPLPNYVVIAQEGAAHEPRFTIAVQLKGYPDTKGVALSKRKAEQIAAEKMLENVQKKVMPCPN